MSADTNPNFPRELFIEPDGPQGGKFGVLIKDKETLESFEQAIRKLPSTDKNKLSQLKNIAQQAGIPIVD